MSKRRSEAAAILGRIKTPKKSASSASNARKATRARLRQQTPEERAAQARKAAAARWQQKP